MRPLELQCFHYGENSIDYEDLGLKKPPITETELRPVTFFVVYAVESYYEAGREYSVIVSGSNEYICNLSYDDAVMAVKEAYQ